MPWLEKDASLEKIRRVFKADRFAAELCGITIEEAEYQHAVCSMLIGEQHRNALGNPMGGVIFTLADYCLAIISNVGEEATSSISNTIEFMTFAKGDTLRAIGRVLKSGRSIGFYAIDVFDDQGNQVAHMAATCHRRATP